METQAKLDLVIKAIVEARSITRKGHAVKVYISSDTGLDAVHPEELKDILLKLQDDERIIRVKSFPDWLLPYARLTMDIVDNQMRAILDPSRNHFIVDTLDGFDKWCADYWKKRKQSSGETLTPLGTQRKPSWAKTNVPWDIKKVIWQSWAKGSTVAVTQRFFELHQGEYEGAPFDKATIQKVRSELGCLPDDLVKTLVTELPEVSSLIQVQKADFKTTPQ